MEFIIVEFDETRDVLIDDFNSGSTNQALMVDEGNHVFRLDGELNYAPASQTVLVQNTAPDHPRIIRFS